MTNPHGKNFCKYEGEFQFGKKDGYGIEDKKLSRYEGQWLKEKKNGFGR